MNRILKTGLITTGAWLLAVMPRMLGRPERMPGVYYAHRGLHRNGTDAPENTMPAFKLAVEAGYGIELDVQLTKDGQVVVVHDFDLKRACGIEKNVDDFTYEELCSMPVFGSREMIPLLTDVLKLVDGKVPLIIEIKYKGKADILCGRVDAILSQYKGRYCIESFHPQVLLWYRKNRPEICRGQLSMNYHRDGSRKAIWYYIPRHLLCNFLTAPDFIAYDCKAKRAVSKNICRLLFGCPSVAWTVKSREELEACRIYYDYFIFEGFLPKQAEKQNQRRTEAE